MGSKIDTEKRKVSIDEVVKKIIKLTGITKEDMLSKKREEKIIEARRLLVYFCKNHTQITNKEIARYLKRDEAVVLRCGRAFNEDEMKSKRKIEEIKNMLWS
jgi:chromosomal replication initiation ATPase DnaA